MSNPQISPDGMWRWDGGRWVPNGDQQLPPPPPAGGAYPYPTVYQTVVNPGTNGFAIASMVLGILWLYWIGSVLALIFGYVALHQIKSSHQGGKGHGDRRRRARLDRCRGPRRLLRPRCRCRVVVDRLQHSIGVQQRGTAHEVHDPAVQSSVGDPSLLVSASER